MRSSTCAHGTASVASMFTPCCSCCCPCASLFHSMSPYRVLSAAVSVERHQVARRANAVLPLQQLQGEADVATVETVSPSNLSIEPTAVTASGTAVLACSVCEKDVLLPPKFVRWNSKSNRLTRFDRPMRNTRNAHSEIGPVKSVHIGS